MSVDDVASNMHRACRQRPQSAGQVVPLDEFLGAGVGVVQRRHAGGSLRTNTRTEIGRARMTHLQGECAYRRTEEEEEEEEEEI